MTKQFLRRWRKRLLLVLLGVILLLIVSLAYKIAEKDALTDQQHLTISAEAAFSVTRNSYSILAAMVRQDYHTYTTMQESIGEAANLTELVYASNISYESRIMDSLVRFQKQLQIGTGMIGVLYLPEDGEGEVRWFQNEYPYKESVISLARDLQRLELDKLNRRVAPIEEEKVTDEINLSELLASDVKGKSEEMPQIHLLDVFDKPCLMFSVPLNDHSRVVCIMDPYREFGMAEYQVSISDKNGTRFDYNDKLAGDYAYARELYGLNLTFSSKSKGDGFLAIILPTALLILIMILYQSHVAIQESHTHELTGLPNMRMFDRFYQETLRRPGTPFLFFLDLRSLKLLNSIFLEEQADEVIKAFAKTLRATLDRNDQIIHRSGDEIVILMTVQDEELLPSILQRIKRVFLNKQVRMRVQQNKDRYGQALTLYGEQLKVGSFIDYPISFRIGGLALEFDLQQLPRKQLLDQVNLLAEQAKNLETENVPAVVWMVKYSQDGQEHVLCSEVQKDMKPRLVELESRQNG